MSDPTPPPPEPPPPPPPAAGEPVAAREREIVREVPRPRRTWLRRLAWTTILLLILLVLIVVAVQAVLWSGLPKRLIVDALRDATGLSVEVGDVDVGWFGRSTVRDVHIRLPLDDDAFLTAPVIHARHAWLPVIALTLDPGLDSIRVDRATLDLREDARGRWNLLRAAELISEMSVDDPDASPPDLPAIKITESTLTLTRATGASVTTPIWFEGASRGGGPWVFSAGVGQSKVDGRLSPAGWSHAARLEVTDIEPIIALWFDAPPTPLELSVAWEGDLLDGSLQGVLTLIHAAAGPTSAAGELAVAIENSDLLLQPAALEVRDPRVPQSPIRIESGTLRITDDALTTRGLRIAAAGLVAQADGRWDIARERADLSARWNTAVDALGVQHYGSAEVHAEFPVVGRQNVQATVQSVGEIGATRWIGELSLSASGATWQTLAGDLSLPRMEITQSDGSQTTLTGFAAALSLRWPVVSLTGLTLPGAEESFAAGQIDTTTGEWTVQIQTRDWTPPALGQGPIELELTASGARDWADISSIHLVTADAELRGQGTFKPHQTPPLQGRVELAAALPTAPPERKLARIEDEETGPITEEEDNAQAAPPQAHAIAVMDVAGALEPLLIEAEGELRTTEWAIGEGVLTPMQVRATARLDEKGAWAGTDPFPLLGGRWTLEASYSAEALEGRARLRAEGVMLDQIAILAAPQVAVGGQLRIDAEAHIPELDPARLEVDGTWSVVSLSRGDWRDGEGRGRLGYRKGRVRIHDIALARGQAQVTGEVAFDAMNTRQLAVDLRTHKWPVALAGTDLRALVESRVQADVNTTALSAVGPFELSAETWLGEAHLGGVTIAGRLDERTINATDVTARLLGGEARGHVILPVDDWTSTNVLLDLSGLDLAGLGAYAGAAEDIRGLVSGRITAGPAQDKRALEPLHAEAQLKIADGRQRGMQFGDMHLIVFAGPDRIVLDQSAAMVAGGLATFWGRLSWHDADPFVHISLRGKDLRLEELARAADPEFPHTPGIVQLESAFGGYVHHPRRAYGEAEIELQESDLGAAPVISDVYGLLNMQGRDAAPRGRGLARLRIEGDRLALTRLHYYNRGADVIASGEVENIWLLGDSRVRGTAAGAIRPLRDSNLPFAEQLDRMFLAATARAVSVRVGGVLQAPEVTVVPLADISTTLRRVLGDTPARPNP